MFRRILTGLSALLLSLGLHAQEASLVERIMQANMPGTLEAKWQQTKHTPLLKEDLKSNGVVYLQQPDKIRWEVLEPVNKVTVMNGASGRGRFRLPTEKDFKATVLEGEDYTVDLMPMRRDLQVIFAQVTLVVDKKSLLIKSALLRGTDGGWTLIEFGDRKMNEVLPEALFEVK